MSVVRVKRHRERFTVLSTATLRTTALSLKARGLWALCLSYPDDWEFRAAHLQAQSERDGRAAVQSALRELEAAGLAALETLRSEDGRVQGKRWTIYEEPALNPSCEGTASTSVVPEAEPAGADGTDERETGPSVEGGAHRQTGFPSDGKPENRETRWTGNPPLRKNKQHERTTPRKKEQQQARAREAPAEAGQAVGGAVPLRAVVGNAAVALQRGSGGDALRLRSAQAEGASSAEEAASLLIRRGIEASVAEDLAQAHGAEAVRRTVQAYDERRLGPKPPSSPGWLVAALRRGFVSETPRDASPLLSHGEMLRWCEANGGLHRTAEFEPVRRPGQPVLFHRRSSPPPSSTPTAGVLPAQTG